MLVWVTGMTCKHLDYLTNYLYQALVHYKPVKGSDEIDVDDIDDVYMYGSRKRADQGEFRGGKGYGGGKYVYLKQVCAKIAKEGGLILLLMPNRIRRQLQVSKERARPYVYVWQ